MSNNRTTRGKTAPERDEALEREYNKYFCDVNRCVNLTKAEQNFNAREDLRTMKELTNFQNENERKKAQLAEENRQREIRAEKIRSENIKRNEEWNREVNKRLTELVKKLKLPDTRSKIEKNFLHNLAQKRGPGV